MAAVAYHGGAVIESLPEKGAHAPIAANDRGNIYLPQVRSTSAVARHGPATAKASSGPGHGGMVTATKHSAACAPARN